MSKWVFDRNTVNEQLNQLSNLLETQRNIKKTLLSYLEKVSDYISNSANIEISETLILCLNNVQEIFDNIKLNIDKLIELKVFLENIAKSTSLNIIDFEKYHNQFTNLSENIENTNASYTIFMEKLLSIEAIDFSNLNYTKLEHKNIIEETTSTIAPDSSETITNEITVENVIEEITENIEETTSTIAPDSSETITNEVAVKDVSEEITVNIEETTSTISPDSSEAITNEVAVKDVFEEITENIEETTSTISPDSSETITNEVIVEGFIENIPEEIVEDIIDKIDENLIESNNDSITEETITKTENSIEEIAENIIEDSVEKIDEENNNTTDEVPVAEKAYEIDPIAERTLVIKQKTQTAILPYSLFDLEEYFSENPEKYSSINDIIEQEYTVSLSDYENTSISRFKQTFKLAKQRSNLSFFESLNYANKLFFENQVEPIIIASCNNIEELDVYLECLNNDILNKFKCFTIIKK